MWYKYMMEEFIGIDIGGTKILGVRINEDMEILSKEKISSYNKNTLDNLLSNILLLIEHLKTDKVKKVGLGIAGFVDHKKGFIYSSPNIPALINVNIKKILQDKTPYEIFVDNDAKSGAVAERFIGKGKDTEDFVFITFGTGIGAAIISNGKLVRGHNNLAGEVGHITLDPSGPLCGCGKYGCFEAFASGEAIKRYYLNHIKAYKNLPILDLVGANVSLIDTPLIFSYFERDALAKETLITAARYIGLGLSIVVNLLNPEKIILSGGVSASLNKIWDYIIDEFNKNTLPIERRNVEFIFSDIGENSVAVGSALMTFKDI
uniref:ROK family protein n=1 Tax=Caldisericum exile TaxID=693075 RepID=A0A7C4TW79_9BACT